MGRALTIGAALLVPALAVAPVCGLVIDARLLSHPVAFAVSSLATSAAWIAGVALAPAAWQAAPARLFAATLVAFAALLGPHFEPNWDYLWAYQIPAEQLEVGVDPWKTGETTNPPTYAQLVGMTHRALRSAAPALSAEEAWFWIFYVHQGVQQALLAALVAMSYRLTRQTGLDPMPAAVLTAVVLLLDAPLRETLLLNQVNLLVLVVIMSAVMLAPRRPLISGALAGFGGAVKIYPFVVLAEWMLQRRWRAVMAGMATVAVIVAVGWQAWGGYAGYLRSFERPAIVRDASLHSLVSNVVRGGVNRIGAPEAVASSLSLAIWVATAAALGVAVLRRRRALPKIATGAHDDTWALVALMVIVFPFAWTHHFLLVTPLALVLLARTVRRMDPVVTFGVLLAVVVPAFGVFPLGLPRLVGAIVLLAAWSRVRELECG